MIRTRIFNILLLCLFATEAGAFFTPEPDAAAASLGLGNKTVYDEGLGRVTTFDTVKYICPDGDNANDGLSPDSPKKTPYSTDGGVTTGGMDGMTSLPGNSVIAFCRGGKFTQNTFPKTVLLNTTDENRLIFRDYLKPGGSRIMPKILINAAAYGNAFLRLEDSSTAEAEEGVLIENLEFAAVNPAIGSTQVGTVVWIYNDADHVRLKNVYMHDMASGVVLNDSADVTNKYADAQMDDLVFTPETTENLGTIVKASGWGAGIKPGFAIVVTNSVSNNKSFRVQSIDYPSNTIYVTRGGDWTIAAESNTVGVMVTINYADGENSDIQIADSKFENIAAAGVFGGLWDNSYTRNSEFINNGFGALTADHHVYISHSHYTDVTGNKFIEVGSYNGLQCAATALVVHGDNKYLTIADNFFDQTPTNSQAGCWAISADGGYTDSRWEQFDYLVIDNNYVRNAGWPAIGCQGCTNTTISNNTIECNKSATACSGISVPIKEPTVNDSVTENVTITGNTVKGYHASQESNTALFGIKAQAGANTAGTITVTNNDVSGWYSCIKPALNTGGTATIMGNTTDCPNDNQP
jgi:hypothetical protein